MKAIILNDFGGVENFELAEIRMPTLASDEVLVKTVAISINPVDVKTRAGGAIADRIRNESPLILGWDISGKIVAVGTGVNSLKVDDEVFAMIAFPKTGKAYAEYVAVKAGELVLKPANISHNEAAAGSMAALTAWQALVKYDKVAPGNRVLIHAAAGGVGHFAVQMAKHLGAYVIGTSSAANRDFVLSLGADEHIDYRSQAIGAATNNIDFVLDTIGGETIARTLKVTKKGGTIVSIVFGMSGHTASEAASLRISGHNMMTQVGTAEMEPIARLFEKGDIRSHISRIFPFEEMAAAHLQLESGRTVGKVVLTF